MIIGGVLGGIVLLALIAGVAVLLWTWSRRRTTSFNTSQSDPSRPSLTPEQCQLYPVPGSGFGYWLRQQGLVIAKSDSDAAVTELPTGRAEIPAILMNTNTVSDGTNHKTTTPNTEVNPSLNPKLYSSGLN